eukprot:m.158048 g.158048  ORF g.158048 m.158048 type:complete len:61 (+) comp15125_c0_seq3:776-958(+)
MYPFISNLDNDTNAISCKFIRNINLLSKIYDDIYKRLGALFRIGLGKECDMETCAKLNHP